MCTACSPGGSSVKVAVIFTPPDVSSSRASPTSAPRSSFRSTRALAAPASGTSHAQHTRATTVTRSRARITFVIRQLLRTPSSESRGFYGRPASQGCRACATTRKMRGWVIRRDLLIYGALWNHSDPVVGPMLRKSPERASRRCPQGEKTWTGSSSASQARAPGVAVVQHTSSAFSDPNSISGLDANGDLITNLAGDIYFSFVEPSNTSAHSRLRHQRHHHQHATSIGRQSPDLHPVAGRHSPASLSGFAG